MASATLCLALCAPCRASYALWEALGYPYVFTACALAYPCVLSVGRRDALCLAYFVPALWGRSGPPSALPVHLCAISSAISRAIIRALHCADSMLRCALPTRAHIHYPLLSLELSLLYPLSFES